MIGRQRLMLIVGAVVVLGLALVLLSPGDDDEQKGGDATVTAPVATAEAPATTTTPAATATAPAPPPAPEFEVVRVRDGRPVGGVKKITVESGERARIEVRSNDTSDEVHLHGYDITRDLAPGRRARFSFDANAEGIFEIELHGSATQIAELTVEP